jgi:hypothetical protein
VRVAVVGNGPSAKGQGKAIDACDLVVRCGQFVKVFTNGSAGRKTSVWAWAGYSKNNSLAPARGTGFWITCPWKWHKGPQRKDNVRALARKRRAKVRVISLAEYMAVRKVSNALSACRRDLPPSTGILAVGMAVLVKPAYLLVCGFDAGKPYADGRKFRTGLHDYFAERKMLEDLEGGRWLGEHHDIDVDWRKL